MCAKMAKQKQTDYKMGRIPEQTFFQRKHTDGQPGT